MAGTTAQHGATQTLRIRAPIDEPGSAVTSEVMHAAQDPAAKDQAVVLNTPFWVDGLNFGDIVRVGREDETGVRPIIEVVIASGHCRVMAVTGSYDIRGLDKRLRQSFPEYALRIEGNGDGVLSVSVHPDLEAEEVLDSMDAWLEEQGAHGEEDVALSPVIQTSLGPVSWPQP